MKKTYLRTWWRHDFLEKRSGFHNLMWFFISSFQLFKKNYLELLIWKNRNLSPNCTKIGVHRQCFIATKGKTCLDFGSLSIILIRFWFLSSTGHPLLFWWEVLCHVQYGGTRQLVSTQLCELREERKEIIHNT